MLLWRDILYVKVLELGCGNSQLSEELYKDGITDITCIDLSPVAVEKAQGRLQAKGYRGLYVFCFHLKNKNREPLTCSICNPFITLWNHSALSWGEVTSLMDYQQTLLMQLSFGAKSVSCVCILLNQMSLDWLPIWKFKMRNGWLLLAFKNKKCVLSPTYVANFGLTKVVVWVLRGLFISLSLFL